jgi:hypothetical protein
MKYFTGTQIKILLAIIGLLDFAIPSFSQIDSVNAITHPELYIEIQDGIFVSKIINHGEDTLKDDAIVSAAYQYEMIYDSTSRVDYVFTECTKNGWRPRLATWKSGRIVTASFQALTDSSRTDPFTVATGDTISFYRELSWYNPKDHRQDTANFFSLDTLDYAVELIDLKNRRLQLLDSLGVLARTSPGVPVLYGMQPIMANISYGIPSSMNGDTVAVRIRLYARGNGQFSQMRNDRFTVNTSHKLGNAYWKSYLEAYGGGLGKRSIQDITASTAGNSSSGLLTIDKAGAGSVRIRIIPPEDAGDVSIVIYNALGQIVFIPFATRSVSSPSDIFYRFPGDGVYLIALVHNGALEQSIKYVSNS